MCSTEKNAYRCIINNGKGMKVCMGIFTFSSRPSPPGKGGTTLGPPEVACVLPQAVVSLGELIMKLFFSPGKRIPHRLMLRW